MLKNETDSLFYTGGIQSLQLFWLWNITSERFNVHLRWLSELKLVRLQGFMLYANHFITFSILFLSLSSIELFGRNPPFLARLNRFLLKMSNSVWMKLHTRDQHFQYILNVNHLSSLNVTIIWKRPQRHRRFVESIITISGWVRMKWIWWSRQVAVNGQTIRNFVICLYSTSSFTFYSGRTQ